MYQIDNSTAVAAIPASTAPGTNGYFTDGNPATGVAATIMPAEFMNMLMMENLNVLAAAGITPVKSQFNQLALAIAKIVQNGAAGAASETSAGILKLSTSALAAAGVDNATAITPQKLAAQIQSGGLAFGVDTGTANTYVCAFAPAITARVEGQVLRFKVKTANTGASTLNDGMSAVPLVGGAHSALQGGELIVNGDAWIQWNTSVGGGSYILLFCTGAPEQVAPASQSQHAINAGQLQTQALTAFATGGTAPAFTLTPVPAITAYAANQRFQVTFNAAGTTPTLNVSGLGAKNLKQYTSAGAKISASVISGQVSDVVYDGTDFVVLDQLPNASGTTAAQFDNSANLATTAFVQGVGLQFSSLVLASANITLTAATHAGAVVVGNSSSAISVTLPSVATMPAKTAIEFWNYSAGTMTLVAAGSDSIYLPGSVTSFAVPTGSSITLVSSGAGVWFAVGSGQQVGVNGLRSNLVIRITGLDSVASISINEITLESSSGLYQTLRNVSVAPSIAASGAGGLDSGAVAANTFYSEWIIWGGGAPSGMFSISATSPTMPSGFTYKARVGWVKTDSTGKLISGTQFDRTFRWKVAGSSNLTGYPVIISGVQGNPSTPTWAATSTSAFAPTTASAIDVMLSAPVNGTGMAAPNNAHGAYNSASNPPPLSLSSSSTTANIMGRLPLESANVYYAANASGISLFALGWEDNL